MNDSEIPHWRRNFDNMSTSWAKTADLFLAMGSSLVVEPAASLPRLAKEHGAKLIILNRDSTPLDSIADAVLHDSLGGTMERLGRELAMLTTHQKEGRSERGTE